MKTSENFDEPSGLVPTRRRQVSPYWLDLKCLGGRRAAFILAPVAIAILLACVSWMRAVMADPQAADAPQPAPIDGDRAYLYLKQICDIGPRPAGSAANTRQRQMVAGHFLALGGKVREQKFGARDPQSGAKVEMANLIGSWFPERVERVVIAAHYDTRPFADNETDPALRNAPFVGANDGASGVALLMEIAHHLRTLPTPWGVDLVLLDGEELVYGRNAPISGYFLGSKEFARVYKASRRDGRTRSKYVYGLILDMVGARDLELPREGYSVKLAPRLVRDVWDVARRLGEPAFLNIEGQEVYDDHLPLNDAGIPTIDLINFEYPYWHKAGDTPDKCSGASLAQVGRVVTAWLSQPKPRPRRR